MSPARFCGDMTWRRLKRVIACDIFVDAALGAVHSNKTMTALFLILPADRHVASNALAFAIHDGFPVSPGHTLIVPRRLVVTWFEATREEQVAMLELVDVVKAQLDAELQPDGYNIGINAGPAAGQTVMHLHMHLIPRFKGDVPDPRGGIRHVIPGKGNYLLPDSDGEQS
jgi:diadenosine tetraphosphate (Ap4A) HIT family hydrolase